MDIIQSVVPMCQGLISPSNVDLFFKIFMAVSNVTREMQAPIF